MSLISKGSYSDVKRQREKSWVKYYLGLPGNDYMIEVDKEYMKDRFNLTGLSEQFPRCQEALRIILDEEPFIRGPRKVDGTPIEVLEQSAEVLYGVIHARYLLTPKGVDAMKKKYIEQRFGKCPRVYCQNQSMLPVGLTDQVGDGCVKLYCPVCQEIYNSDTTRYQNCDGAFFGTGFPIMFLMTIPELRPSKPSQAYVPKLFGFKVHPLARGLGKDSTLENKTRLARSIDGIKMTRRCIKVRE